jgi:TetR/AcrR family transcriptional repressor of nem operon
MPRGKSFDPDKALGLAMELFWDRGFEGTSISSLESHLGLGRVSLYGAFGDKRQLFLACLAKYRRDVTLPLLQLLDDDDGLAGIRRFFAALTQASNASGHRGCFIVNTLVSSSGGDREIDEFVRDHLNTVELKFMNAVSKGQAQRSIDHRIDVREAARLLVTLTHGTLSLNRSQFGANTAQAGVEMALRELAFQS